MVNITHTGENPDKTSQILEAAQKRFGFYGFEKTTMNEIASDLNMSKGSLYYYYPDKEHLYMAVIRKEHELFIQTVAQKIDQLQDPAQMIREYVKVRLTYFRTLLNLSRFRHDNIREFRSMMHELWKTLRVHEQELISNILQKGVEKQLFEVESIEEVSDLLLDILKSLSISVVKKKDIFYLEENEYNGLKHKIYLFTEMFIKSLKK